MKKHLIYFICLLVSISATNLSAQDAEIDRLINNEGKMTFPSIYFKHNSTDYTAMPYTVDSCFNYIALHIKDINDLVIWRDSLETEKLTKLRIKKLKMALSKHKETRHVSIESMDKQQKISRYTMSMTSDSTKTNYLLCLNSVFEIGQIRLRNKPATKSHKVFYLPCWLDWRLDRSGREHCKMERRIRKKQQASQKQ